MAHRAIVRLVLRAAYATFGPDASPPARAKAFDASTFEIWARPVARGAARDRPRRAARPCRPRRLVAVPTASPPCWLTAGLFHEMVEYAARRSSRGVERDPDGRRPLSRSAVSAWPTDRSPGPRSESSTATGRPSARRSPAAIPSRTPSIPAAQSRSAGRSPTPPPTSSTAAAHAGRRHRGALWAAGVARIPEPPELTAEVHRRSVQPPRARLYRTGDRARWRPDGTLEFLGRSTTR